MVDVPSSHLSTGGCQRYPNMFIETQDWKLVGGLGHLDYFSIQLGISSSQLIHIFQRGRSTTNQMNQPSKWDSINKQVGISHHNGDLPKTKCGCFFHHRSEDSTSDFCWFPHVDSYHEWSSGISWYLAVQVHLISGEMLPHLQESYGCSTPTAPPTHRRASQKRWLEDFPLNDFTAISS